MKMRVLVHEVEGGFKHPKIPRPFSKRLIENFHGLSRFVLKRKNDGMSDSAQKDIHGHFLRRVRQLFEKKIGVLIAPLIQEENRQLDLVTHANGAIVSRIGVIFGRLAESLLLLF